jgi:hypothetical protein
LAAFVAASLQNVATGFGGHSFNESVHARPVPLFWLKCSLWHNEQFTTVCDYYCIDMAFQFCQKLKPVSPAALN